jgi:trigger factor
VIERQFGDHVRQEVFGKLIQQSLHEAVEKEDIAIVGSPQIETEQAQPGQALRYSATVEVYPEVDANGYAGLDLERPVRAVSDEDVDRYLGELRESLSQLRPIEDRTAVQQGDVATIDYEGKVEGKTVARGENRPCQIGQGNFPPGFEDRLVGAEVGSHLEFELALAEDYGSKELAGKTVSFQVTIRSLAKKEVPELDDDFAKDHGECDTLEQLRARVKGQLEAAASRQADEQLRSGAVGKVVDAQGEIEVPSAMIEQRLKQLVGEVVEEWQQRRIWPKDEAAAFASLQEELTPRATAQVRTAVVLDAVARKEGIEVTDGDVEDEIERVAGTAGDAADRVRSIYGTDEARENLRTRLRRQRVVELVVERAQVRDVAAASSVIAGEGESR